MNINFYLLRQRLIDLDHEMVKMNENAHKSGYKGIRYNINLFWTPDKFWIIGDQKSVLQYMVRAYLVDGFGNLEINSGPYSIPGSNRKYTKLVITPK